MKLLEPLSVGAMDLPHRVVMAPMTRSRAGAGNAPTEMNAVYYAQRASAAFIVTEGTQPSPTGQGYGSTPGIHDPAQEAGWSRVATAVHAHGGRIVLQLMHTGRISHPVFQPGGILPVAPSAVRPAGSVFTERGMLPFVTPRPLRRDELPTVRDEHVDAARRAIAAGMDGVELHAANGYLLHQFLAENTNRRNDGYGGTPARRVRFVVEVAAALADAIGPERVGVRISPANPFNDIEEPDAERTYPELLRELGRLGLAYLHVCETPPDAPFSALGLARRHWDGPLVANSGQHVVWTLEHAEALLTSGLADLIGFGRAFLANPDLPERVRVGGPLNEPDRDTFYGGGAEGYIDYPTLDAAGATPVGAARD